MRGVFCFFDVCPIECVSCASCVLFSPRSAGGQWSVVTTVSGVHLLRPMVSGCVSVAAAVAGGSMSPWLAFMKLALAAQVGYSDVCCVLFFAFCELLGVFSRGLYM